MRREKVVTVDPEPLLTAGRDVGTGRFLPGNHAGRGFGRPKLAATLSDVLRSKLEQPAEGKKRKNNAAMIADRLIEEALRGNIRAIMYIFDRLEGSPVQTQFQAQREDIPFVFGWSDPHPDNGHQENE